MRNYLLCLAAGTCLAMGVVHQRVGLILMGYQVESARSVRDDLLDQNRVLHYNVFTLRSPVILQERLARQDVRLTPPQVIELSPPRLGVYPSGWVPNGAPGLDLPWWRQALNQSIRWFQNGRQAVAAPARE